MQGAKLYLSNVAKPHVARITEVHPRLRRIHVTGEIHPGELAARGYRDGVREIRTTEELLAEFQTLRNLGYGFAEGDEWSPAELYRKYRDLGQLSGGA